jgi:iron complex transport system permease protein
VVFARALAQDTRVLLLCADTTTRALLPTEIPIGVLTALIGGPFFCYVFRKRQTMRGSR